MRLSKPVDSEFEDYGGDRYLFVDESNNPSFVPLLGRNGFFSEFKISFDAAGSKLSLKGNDSQGLYNGKNKPFPA